MLTTWTQPLHGGKSQEDTEEDSSGGSTPRVWGKLSRFAGSGYGRGLNPTCVGKTLPDKVKHLQDA